MACSWLKPKRAAQRLTQQNVADHLGLDVRVYRRWECCERTAKREEVPYRALADLLEVGAVQLCEDHLRDLEAAGQAEHATEARNALAKLRRARYFPPVDPAPIEAALVASVPTGLVADIAARIGAHRPAEQAARIANWLGQGDLDALFAAVNRPLEQTVPRATGQDQLAALWHFLLAVMHGGAARDPDIGAGGHYLRPGEARAWPHRLLIDNAKDLNGMRTVTLDPKRQYQLDDGRDSTRAVQFRALTMTSFEDRVHELINEVAATLALDQLPPPVADVDAFEDYCERLNAALATHNFRDSHVFALCGPDSLETDEVKARLRSLLSHLRLFDCTDTGADSSLLRVDRADLEGWYAWHLSELQQRGLRLDPQPEADPSTDKTQPKENPMPDSEKPPTVVNNYVSVQSGSGHTSAQAGRDARVTQQTNGAPLPDQVLALIEQLLADSKERKGETKDLRQAALKAQAELEADEAVSSQTKSWLQSAFDALPKADQLIGTGTKLLDLIAKLPGTGP